MCLRTGRSCPLPITQLTGDGALQLAWDNSRRYIDVELLKDGKVHWCFRDRDSEESLGTSDDPIADLPEVFFERLSGIIATQS